MADQTVEAVKYGLRCGAGATKEELLSLCDSHDNLLAAMVAFTDEGGGLVEDLRAQAWSDEGDDTDKLAAVRAILHGDEWVDAVDAVRAAIAATKEAD